MFSWCALFKTRVRKRLAPHVTHKRSWAVILDSSLTCFCSLKSCMLALRKKKTKKVFIIPDTWWNLTTTHFHLYNWVCLVRRKSGKRIRFLLLLATLLWETVQRVWLCLMLWLPLDNLSITASLFKSVSISGTNAETSLRFCTVFTGVSDIISREQEVRSAGSHKAETHSTWAVIQT